MSPVRSEGRSGGKEGKARRGGEQKKKKIEEKGVSFYKKGNVNKWVRIGHEQVQKHNESFILV